MVEQVTPAASDPAFGDAVLPGIPKRSPDRSGANRFCGAVHFCAKPGGTAKDQVAATNEILDYR